MRTSPPGRSRDAGSTTMGYLLFMLAAVIGVGLIVGLIMSKLADYGADVPDPDYVSRIPWGQAGIMCAVLTVGSAALILTEEHLHASRARRRARHRHEDLHDRLRQDFAEHHVQLSPHRRRRAEELLVEAEDARPTPRSWRSEEARERYGDALARLERELAPTGRPYSATGDVPRGE